MNTAPKNRAAEDHSPSLDGVGPGARRPGKQHGSFKRGLRSQHAEFPPARIEREPAAGEFRLRQLARGRSNGPAATADTERSGSLLAAERALVWLRRNASSKQPAASRVCRPKARSIPPAWIERVWAGEFYLRKARFSAPLCWCRVLSRLGIAIVFKQAASNGGEARQISPTEIVVS